MIVTRTPLRISLAGGGTDLPAFYKLEAGAVVSFTIDKYVYITLNRKFDGRTRVSYSRTENVDYPIDLDHDLARECLQYYHATGLEVTSVSDIPGEGTGLGSSSAYVVGLCRALSHRMKEILAPDELAERAFTIERTICRHPVGKQDPYAAAFGSVNQFKFLTDRVIQVPMSMSALRLQESLMLFWTGRTRSARELLRKQEENIATQAATLEGLVEIRNIAMELADSLAFGQIDALGPLLHRGWEIKKTLAPGITEDWIDDLYERALGEGATGGKLCGAGGGGFLLFAVPKNRQERVENALPLRRVPFRIDNTGSRVVYSD